MEGDKWRGPWKAAKAQIFHADMNIFSFLENGPHRSPQILIFTYENLYVSRNIEANAPYLVFNPQNNLVQVVLQVKRMCTCKHKQGSIRKETVV